MQSNPLNLIIIGSLIGINFYLGKLIEKYKRKTYLYLGVFINLLIIFYFKYLTFFLGNINYIFSYNIHTVEIEIPLAISFVIFHQISFLVDIFRRVSPPLNFTNYVLFISFFPHLLAGPIVYFREISPQFNKLGLKKEIWQNLYIGLALFSFGLFKKVVLADTLVQYVDPIFASVSQGNIPSFFEAWFAAFAYTYQLYFDFSGYSDMAIGLARMFGIYFPQNFNSPYKSVNIIEFWRRWHITLSKFLKEYLYIPLGGNKKGFYFQNFNTFSVMLIGGLWHGASWTFVAWGALHGLYIIINRLWQKIVPYFPYHQKTNFLTRRLSQLLTFLSVVIGWVIFRSQTLSDSITFLKSMCIIPTELFSYNSVLRIESINNLFAFNNKIEAKFFHISWNLKNGSMFLLFLTATLLFFPNTFEIIGLKKNEEIVNKNYLELLLKPNLMWCFVIVSIFSISLTLINRTNVFLYFNF